MKNALQIVDQIMQGFTVAWLQAREKDYIKYRQMGDRESLRGVAEEYNKGATTINQVDPMILFQPGLLLFREPTP